MTTWPWRAATISRAGRTVPPGMFPVRSCFCRSNVFFCIALQLFVCFWRGFSYVMVTADIARSRPCRLTRVADSVISWRPTSLDARDDADFRCYLHFKGPTTAWPSTTWPRVHCTRSSWSPTSQRMKPSRMSRIICSQVSHVSVLLCRWGLSESFNWKDVPLLILILLAVHRWMCDLNVVSKVCCSGKQA